MTHRVSVARVRVHMDPLAFYSGGLVKPAEVFLGKSLIFLFEVVSIVRAEPGLPGLLVPSCWNPTGEHTHCCSAQDR